jgi:hypothetical protein
MSIVTEYVAPPVPTTMYDWVAYVDGEEEPCGRGPTEAEALRDLCEKLHDLRMLEGGSGLDDTAERALKAVVNHWREFGPRHGFDECLELAARALPPNVANERRP